VVITALAFSLVECLLILPAHLGHRSGMGETLLSPLRALPEPARRVGRSIRDGYLAMRRGIERAIQVTIDQGFMPLHRLCVRRRFVTLGVFVGLMIVAFGAYKGKHIRTNFFPKIDSDTIKADLVLPTGTGFQETSDIARRIAAGAEQLNKQFGTEDGRPIIQNLYALAGQTMRGGQAGGHVAEVILELAPGEVRGVKSQRIAEQWRENVGPVPQALSLTYGALRGGPGGRPFEIRLLGETVDQLKPAARELEEALKGYAGVFDVEDDALPGKMEMRIGKTARAETLNITLDALATQIRDAFEGREVVKIQQGREEIEVVVRYPPKQRRTLSDVENMRIRTPAGDEIPFYEVADVSMAQGYTTLRRVGDHAVVTVSADLDESVANAEQVLGELRSDGVFSYLEQKYAPLEVDLRGQRQQAMESLSSLMIWFPLALVGIYTVLAAIFRSYVQPIIIMVAIPFGLLGAVVGHWLLGMSLTLLSLFGMVALTGIVVNDSLVLIDLINQRFRGGMPVIQAVFASARDRFRPIFLTTATTVCGIAPLLLEQSFQAQFLKPMVVSLAFGLMFATLLTLLVVPCLYVIGSDIRRAMRWIYGGQWTPAHRETVG
jgi:multidrug efflux pump subunit AcrB